MLLILFALTFCLATTAMAAENSVASPKKGRLRHVVAFKFKDTASKEDIEKIVEAFGALKKKIPTILSYEWGANNSPENHNKGFTHAFTLTFNSEKDRNDYLVHPAHKDFGKLLGPFLADVFVIDYWIQD
ncbi:MAG TPA: Dabb family protein [Verrucomicrobiae bacterium]|nr:Dabb family protein [Verrucomicrobiae bacterium]